MEASGAGLAAPAGGDAGDAQGQEQTQGQQESQQQAGLSPELAQALDSLPSTLEDMRTWMEQSQQPAQDDPGAAEPEPLDFSYADPSSPGYDPEQAAATLLGQIEQQTQQAVQQAVTPLQQQIAEQRAEREADYLAQKYPDLEDPAVQERVFKATSEWVQAAGLPPEAAQNMRVVEAVYNMGRLAEMHNAEQQQGGPQAASLEGAGGASPGGSGGGQFTAESIVGNGGRSVLPFG